MHAQDVLRNQSGRHQMLQGSHLATAVPAIKQLAQWPCKLTCEGSCAWQLVLGICNASQTFAERSSAEAVMLDLVRLHLHVQPVCQPQQTDGYLLVKSDSAPNLTAW